MSAASRAEGRQCWPVRLLVAADFSGGHNRGEIRRAIDGAPIDDLLSAVKLEIPAAPPGIPRELRISRMADFAPRSLRAALALRDGDVASQERIDGVLHAPAFQAIESAWRGLALLLAQAPGSGGADAAGAGQVDLIDVDLAALRRTSGSALESALGGGETYTAILIDTDLDAPAGDGAFLEALATLAERRRTPVILGGAPALLGLRHAAHLPGIADPAARLDAAWGGAWRALRAADAARWITVTVNRFLLRPLLTEETDGHRETASPARPGDYLWGRGVWLAGADLLRSANRHGNPLAISGALPERFHSGLPRWSWTGPGGARLMSSLEAALDQNAVQLFVRAGLSPIFETAGPGTALLPLLVNAYRPDPKRIPVEGTLAHTLVLAHFVEAFARGAQLAASEPDDGAAGALLRDELQSALGPRLGDGTAAALETSVARPAGTSRTASASLRGDLTGSGRSEEIEISISL